jgi:hypothetical protein
MKTFSPIKGINMTALDWEQHNHHSILRPEIQYGNRSLKNTEHLLKTLSPKTTGVNCTSITEFIAALYTNILNVLTYPKSEILMQQKCTSENKVYIQVSQRISLHQVSVLLD